MRTMLFGLDGATFTVLDSLIAAGVMPRLGEILGRGTRAHLLSTPMPITPQAWTSMTTGRSPGHHGINDFIRCDRTDRGIHWRLNDARDNHAETIWATANRYGQRATVINFIATAPPAPMSGHLIPGFTSGRHLRRSSYPRDLFDRIENSSSIDMTMLGLDYDIERQALQDMEPERYEEFIRHHIERDRVLFGILETLMKNEPSELTMLVLDGVDKIQHLAYRFLDPDLVPKNPTSWEQQVIDLCHAYFRQVDDFLGRSLELLGPWGRLFIASDHGFTATTQVVYINKWLEQQGYLVWKQAPEQDEKNAIFSAKLSDLSASIDLDRTRAFALTPSCNGIFLAPDSPEEKERLADEIIRKLMSLRDSNGNPVVIEVKKRDQWFAGPFVERFPDLTLTLSDYGLISVLNGPDVVVPREVAAGTHHPHGILIGVGPGIKAGEQASLRNIMDVAPLLAHSLGLPLRADFEGAFPENFYEAAYLQSDPPRREQSASIETVHAGAPKAEAADEEQLTEDDEQMLFERLKSLGYVE